ncbi:MULTISPECIES: cytochrome o ubiquinol oxidase subunit IV [Salinicola]|uniref:cytochrome o ubiquinol oxidase subunit IV n=1 Tax=Salinicola TaxID=404432 RepID=UPI000DA207EE|nr:MULTISPECIES: cytochrome o ubiquinol oxidase subunit IV [Salinicola]
MSHRQLSDEEAREKAQELRSYCWGFGLAAVLTLIPFGLAAFTQIATATLYWVIGVCGVIQIVVHFRFFLHITLARNKREDLQLILFTVLILTIMVGGTLWILFNLYYRMMPSMIP